MATRQEERSMAVRQQAGPGVAAGGTGRLSQGSKTLLEDELRRVAAALQSAPVDASAELLAVPKDLSKVVPRPLRKSIYIRPLYRKLLARINTAGSHSAAIVTGSPGVGKSAFALLLIAHLAKRGYRVLYSFHHDLLGRLLIRFDFKEGMEPEVEAERDDGNLRYAWLNTGLADNKGMLIIDGPAPDGEFSGAVKTVVLAPPTRKHWSKFQKGCDCSSGEEVNLYFLDIWHPAEVEKARSFLYPDVTPSTAAERYRIFGGVVRMVLVNHKATLNLNEFALMDVAKLQHLDLLGVESDVPHQLMHIRADADLEMRYSQLASPVVAAWVHKRLLAKHKGDARGLLAEAAGQTTDGGWVSWVGRLLEQQDHISLHEDFDQSGQDVSMCGLGGAVACQAAASSPAKKQKREDEEEEEEELLEGDHFTEGSLAAHDTIKS